MVGLCPIFIDRKHLKGKKKTDKANEGYHPALSVTGDLFVLCFTR